MDDEIKKIIENCGELPDDFKITDYQWRLISREVPEVVSYAIKANSEIKDTVLFRNKVQNGLLLRFYRISQAAKKIIEEQNLHTIEVDALLSAKKGAFIAITQSGSIHYIEILERCDNQMRCSNYDRQSYYKLDLSEQTRMAATKETADSLIETKIQIPIADMQKEKVEIAIEILANKRLKVYKRDAIIYKHAFTSTPLEKIYTSEKIEATSRGYKSISGSATHISQAFLDDITRF